MPSVARCPECGYSLTGLPDEHRCPECGFAFQAAMLVLEGRRTAGYLGVTIRILLTVWLGVGVGGALYRQKPIHALANGIGLALVGLCWRSWVRRRRPYYVVLTAPELIYRERGREKLRMDLRDVSRAGK